MLTQTMKIGLHVIGAACVTAILGSAQADTPVADAAMQGDTETVRSLLRAGADVNTAQGDGMTALHWAAYKGNAEVARILIYAGGNPRALTRLHDYTPLILASSGGHADVIVALLEAGADVNAVTSAGASSIHLAAANISGLGVLIPGPTSP